MNNNDNANTVNDNRPGSGGAAFRWLLLGFGSLTLLLGGLIYSWSILKSPLAGEFGWNPAQLALNFTITICCFGIGGLISGFLAKRLSPRIRLIGSAILVFIGFFLSSGVEAESLGLLYISYGVLGGIGIGVLYNTALSTIGEWFPDKKGLASGIMLMCFGFSTLIFGSIAGSLIAVPTFGWRKTCFLMGLVMASVVFIFGLIARRPKALSTASVRTDATSDTRDYTAGEMLKTATFWKLFIALTLLATIGNVTLSFAKDFAMFTGSAETTAITIVGIMSVCNGFGRLFIGSVYDRLPLRKTQVIIAIIMIVAPIIGVLAVALGGKVLGILALLTCGFTYGLCPTTSAIYPKLFFGEKNYALNFSITNLTLIPTSFVATLAGAILTATDSYMPVFCLLLAFAIIGSISLLLIKK